MPEGSAFSIPHSPIAALGTLTILVAFVVAAYAATAGLVGNAQRRRRLVTSSVHALYGFFALMMLASALLIYAFVTHDYTIKYVAHYSDTTMPLSYKITAYWGGLDGSLMFWVSVLSAFSAIAVKVNAKRHRDMIGYVVFVIMVVEVFFLALLIYNKNPFATWLTAAPADGKGLNPLLQNYWMVIHPPSLYTGYVAATIPFAFGMAALASGRLDDQWLSSVRVWVFLSWFFLSFGLILGGRWAYEELGWGGYWAWDPVENAGLLPWFTATAFLHAVIIQEQRGMMKVWNLALVIITFVLTIIGTGLTRSGAVQSVHAFGEDNALALMFVLFLCLIIAASVGMLLYRLPRLKSAATFESFMSREFAFLLNNWILLACALFVFFATMWPTLSEAFTGQRITLGPPFFNKWMIPLGLTLLFLAGAAPLLAYRRTTRTRLWNQFAVPLGVMLVSVAALAVFVPRTLTLTSVFADNIKLPMSLIDFGLIAFTMASIGQEFWRGMRVRRRQTGSDHFTSLIGLIFAKRRKYGGYVIHLGVAIMFIAFGGKAYDGMHDFTVTHQGQTFQYRGYTFKFAKFAFPGPASNDNRTTAEAWLSVWQGNDKVADMRPAKYRYSKDPDEPTTEVDISSHLEEDIYMVLTGYDQKPGGVSQVNFRVYINPLINWLWIGFGFLFLGTMICLVPQDWIDKASPPRKTKLGRLGEAAGILLVLAGVTFGMTQLAHAQVPGQGAARAMPAGALEHQDQSGPAAGHFMDGAHLYRADDPAFLAPWRAKARAAIQKSSPGLTRTELDQQVDAAVAPIVASARSVMNRLRCECGCPADTVYACKCGIAAKARGQVLEIYSRHDLLTAEGRQKAHDEAIADYQRRYGGEVALIVPRDEGVGRLAWLVPYVVVAAGLFVIYGVSRRWVKRGRAKLAEDRAAAAAVKTQDDEEYADLLDDELRDTD